MIKSCQSSKLNKLNINQYNRLYNIQRYAFLDQKLFNQDHYQVLGVKPGTSKEEIKKQYYKLTKLYHPDVSTGNEEKFKKINSAWDVLSDDKKRQEYDNYNGFFGHSNQSSSSTQDGQGFNPFKGFNQGSGQFGGQNPFHNQGYGQNPFGAGSPFENVDLDSLLRELKKNGIKLEDIQSNPHFNDFNQMFGLSKEEPKNLKDKVTHKIKQEAIKLMLRKVSQKLEKEIQYHKEQKEKYQQASSGFQQTNRQTNYYQQNPYTQQTQQNNTQNQQEFDPFKGFKNANQTYYTNKPNGSSNGQSSNQSNPFQDSVNKASNMFSQFFKKK